MAHFDHTPKGDPCADCGGPAIKHRVRHNPKGDPCAVCQLPASRHLVKHSPSGDPCICGAPLSNHFKRTYSPREIERKRVRSRERARDTVRYYIGLDGEGQGRTDHKYVLLAASDETGRYKWAVENRNGLGTIQCLEFLLSLPLKRTKVFSFGFNYDITKILTDVSDKHLFALFRPELRQRIGKEAFKGPRPVRWNGYDLNLQGSKFTIEHKASRRRIVVWDIFRFYGTKFVSALRDWKTGDPTPVDLETLDPRIVPKLKEWAAARRIKDILPLDLMEYMKDHRAQFDNMPWGAVKAYCLEECMYIAQQARKLTDAHDKIGLRLTAFYGAGSSASAMLKKMGIREQLRPAPDEMKQAVASAFFGGRFENSVIGAIREKVWNYDISSAYPYQLCFLPCLLHGRWEQSTDRASIENARTALVQYRLRPSSETSRAWAPFPFRTEDGSITFPKSSGGGYVWRDEYLQGERLFSNVQFLSAWVYHGDCDCKPFAEIPGYYLERLRIGKEGPGIVIKLGCNSCYGKIAQSIGLAPFNSWIWAGLITSGTRAQMLEVLGLHKDYANLLMVATDGIYTRERLTTPRPRDTGTFGGYSPKKGYEKYRYDDIPAEGRDYKPLGGWEEKPVEKGVFISRPGIYFPMNPTQDEIKDVRGRGVGKGVVLENWEVMMRAWEARPKADTSVHLANVSRFCGGKTSISYSEKTGFKRADGLDDDGRRDLKKPAYGQWIEREIKLSFHPMPKRHSLNADGLTLKLRTLPQHTTSTPYSRALMSQEARAMKDALQESIEQPDGGDLSDYEGET